MDPTLNQPDDSEVGADKPIEEFRPETAEWASDSVLLGALRSGDENAFSEIVRRNNSYMIRLAGCYVRDRSAAEEVVQDTWLGLLRGLERFEERSSLRTWLFRILTNKAKTRAKRDSRSVPFADLVTREVTAEDPAVDASHFHGPNGAEPGHWRGEVVPNRWAADPERDFLSNETMEWIKKAMDGLPDAQRAVMMLRDLQGFSSEETCNALEISETNQRVLLHRARAKVRRALAEFFSS